MQREKEPTLPSEDVHIMLPWPTDTLRAVSDRYKSLSDKLFVLANMAGELKLRVESDEVKVETKWTGLVNPPLGKPPHFPTASLAGPRPSLAGHCLSGVRSHGCEVSGASEYVTTPGCVLGDQD